jgi:CRISPR system Cascade subunit CasE
MYLSRLTLDPRHPQARRDLSSRYEMHRTLARAFAPDAQTQPVRFLWRLEPSLSFAPTAVLLVQSEALADWSVMDALPGYAQEIRANKAVDLERLIQPDGRYRFRLYANPTVTRQGKRFGLFKESDQLAWLERQAENGGFALGACLVSGSERIEARQGKGGGRIIVQTAMFEGILTALETASLALAVRTGLGHGKAWGLGLLSLAPIA